MPHLLAFLIFLFLDACTAWAAKDCEPNLANLVSAPKNRIRMYMPRGLLGPLFSDAINKLAKRPPDFLMAVQYLKSVRVAVARGDLELQRNMLAEVPKQPREEEIEKLELEAREVRELEGHLVKRKDLSAHEKERILQEWEAHKDLPLAERCNRMRPLLRAMADARGSVEYLLPGVANLATGFGGDNSLEGLERVLSEQRKIFERNKQRREALESRIHSNIGIVEALTQEGTYGPTSETPVEQEDRPPLHKKLTDLYIARHDAGTLSKTPSGEETWEETLWLKPQGDHFERVAAARFGEEGVRPIRLKKITVKKGDSKAPIFIVEHGPSEGDHRKPDMEVLQKYLERLWNQSLDEPTEKAARSIAELEAIFTMINFPTRAGASIGDALGITLTVNRGLNLRKAFESTDFEAIGSESLDAYITKKSAFLLEKN